MDVTQEQINALYDAEVMSVDGDRLGPVRQVYLDDRTGAPTWITVRTGWFGGREHPVPLEGSERTDEGIRVSASGPEVREAPTVEEDEHLDEARLDELYRYYGLAPRTRAERDGQVRPGGEVLDDSLLPPEPSATDAAPGSARPGGDDLTGPPRLRRHPRGGME